VWAALVYAEIARDHIERRDTTYIHIAPSLTILLKVYVWYLRNCLSTSRLWRSSGAFTTLDSALQWQRYCWSRPVSERMRRALWQLIGTLTLRSACWFCGKERPVSSCLCLQSLCTCLYIPPWQPSPLGVVSISICLRHPRRLWTYLPAYLSICLPACLPACCLPACLPTCLPQGSWLLYDRLVWYDMIDMIWYGYSRMQSGRHVTPWIDKYRILGISCIHVYSCNTIYVHIPGRGTVRKGYRRYRYILNCIVLYWRNIGGVRGSAIPDPLQYCTNVL
jgi:hypothetical protein